MNTSFWKAGHAPTLFAAFLYFDLSFMVWYVLGPLGVQIASDLQLSTQQRGMMVATPGLAGALVRIVIEAGGRFTSLAGVDGPWGGDAIATNGRRAAQRSAVVRRSASSDPSAFWTSKRVSAPAPFSAAHSRRAATEAPPLFA